MKVEMREELQNCKECAIPRDITSGSFTNPNTKTVSVVHWFDYSAGGICVSRDVRVNGIVFNGKPHVLHPSEYLNSKTPSNGLYEAVDSFFS